MNQYLGVWLQAATEELESVSLFRVKHIQLTFVCNERRNGGGRSMGGHTLLPTTP